MKVTINEKQTMKYTTKTAIEIMTEDDSLEVIPFFEHHFPNCNIDSIKWVDRDVFIGEIWGINEFGNLDVTTDKNDLSGYTILKGVPKDWRDETQNNEVLVVGAESYPKTLEIIIEEQKQKLDQLESENNELKHNQIPKSLIDLVYNVKRMVECYQYGKIGIAERELGLIKESLDDIMRLPKEKTQDF